jgi:peptidoglycan hydrolase-like protein with peptidoglycan-binding domain
MLNASQFPRWKRLGLSGLLCLGMGSAVAQTSAPDKPPTSAAPAKKSKRHTMLHTTGKTTSKRASSRTTRHTHGKKVATKRGQQAIDEARTREIQSALIRQNYIQGEPSGSWDSATQDAMRRYQADQGWQAKTIPDSRALIRLGLGPSSDHLLNPESAMTAPSGLRDPKAAATKTAPDDKLPKQ